MSNDSLPEEVAETPGKNTRRGEFLRDAAVLGFLVLAQVVFITVCFRPDGPGASGVSEYFLMGTAGVLLAQPFLLAFWAAFAQQHFFRRFLWCFFLCTVIFFSEAASNLRYKNAEIGAIIFVQFLFFFVAALLMLAARKFLGWRIQKAADIVIASEYRATQFGIKHLILLTAITALTAGLFRSLYLIQPFYLVRLVQAAGAIGIYFVMLLPAIVLPWYTLAHHANVLSLAGFSVVSFAGIDVFVYFVMQYRPFFPAESFPLLLCLQLGATLSILFTTLPLRFCGYRMVRMRRVAPAE
jgi:hypothetical protein